MMLEVLAFPLDTNDVVKRLETIGAEDQGVREVREHRYPGVLQGWHCDSRDGRGTDEDAPHHDCAQVDDILGQQDRGDECQAGSMFGDGEDWETRWMWTRSRRDRPKELPKELPKEPERARTPRLPAGTARRKCHRPSAARDKGVSTKKSRRVLRKGDSKSGGKGKKEFEGKCFKMGATCRCIWGLITGMLFAMYLVFWLVALVVNRLSFELMRNSFFLLRLSFVKGVRIQFAYLRLKGMLMMRWFALVESGPLIRLVMILLIGLPILGGGGSLSWLSIFVGAVLLLVPLGILELWSYIAFSSPLPGR